MLSQLLRELEIRVAKLEELNSESHAPSAEKDFFDNPQKREVLEFAISKAISNLTDTAVQSVQNADNPKETKAQAARKSKKAPPTPSENKKEPGGKQFPTLNRFVITTEVEEAPDSLPQSHDEVLKAEKPPTSLEQKKAVRRAYLLRKYR